MPVPDQELLEVTFTVNGFTSTLWAHPLARLLDILRDKLRLTGTKEGCGEGECGACAVRLDGRMVNSCLVPMCQVAGREVETIEGLGAHRHLRVVQEAFVTLGGAQCGICTPGMVVAVAELLEHTSRPTAAEIRQALAGNLCRCTGYAAIVEAVLHACSRLEAES